MSVQADFANKYKTSEAILRILKVAKKYWIFFAGGCLLMIISSIIAPWPGFAIKIITDAISGGDLLKTDLTVNVIPRQLNDFGIQAHFIHINLPVLVNWIPAILGIFFFLRGLCELCQEFLIRYFGLLVSQDFMRQMYDRTIHLRYSVLSERTSGDLASAITTNSASLGQSISDVIICVVQDSVYTLAFGAGLLLINWKLSFVCLFVVPIFLFVTLLIFKHLKSLATEGQVIVGKLMTFIMETINGLDIIQLMNAHEKFSKRFDNLLKESLVVNMRSTLIDCSTSPLMGLLGASIIGLSAISIGFRQVLAGEMSIGDMSSFVVLAVLIYQPIRRLLRITGKINTLVGSVYRVFTLLDTPSEESGEKSVDLTKESLSLELKNVTFSYKKSKKPVLKDVNLKIKQGEKIAFVGPSGVGKSTIVKLIPYFYEIQKGEIFLSNISLKDWDLNELRKNISIVSQETFLFSGTLRENLQLANPEATDEQIIEALKLANVNFLGNLEDLEDKSMSFLDTELKERASNFSGGQKQRLGIARAFLKNSPLLILDEPTSALDIESEELVQKSLKRLIHEKEKTIILVTHKLSLIRDFDKIVCLKNGKIEELGSHSELIEKKGYYAGLVEAAEVR